MISSDFNRITLDVQIPQGFTLDEEQKADVAGRIKKFSEELGEAYAKKGDGGVVVSNYDTLKNHHNLVVVVGVREVPKKNDDVRNIANPKPEEKAEDKTE